MRQEEPLRRVVPSEEHRYRHERTLGLGLLVGLLITCPTFLVEEFWHGKPLIDQRGIWWVVPAIVMAIGFLAGGAIVGRHCRRRESAYFQGALVGTVTVWIIFIADLIRRHAIGKGLYFGVGELWVVSAIGAIVAGGLGGLIGRRHSGPMAHKFK